jgi:hypothetical protein
LISKAVVEVLKDPISLRRFPTRRIVQQLNSQRMSYPRGCEVEIVIYFKFIWKDNLLIAEDAFPGYKPLLLN